MDAKALFLSQNQGVVVIERGTIGYKGEWRDFANNISNFKYWLYDKFWRSHQTEKVDEEIYRGGCFRGAGEYFAEGRPYGTKQ